MSQAWQDALAVYELEKKLQSEQAKFLFEQSRTYNTVIMGLAYGGFFAMWSSVNSFSGDKRTVALAGALMTISIVAFVAFTLLNMFTISRAMVANARLATLYTQIPTTPTELVAHASRIKENAERLNAELRAQALWVAKLWPPFFYVSVIAGFVGAFTLLFLLLKHHGLGLF